MAKLSGEKDGDSSAGPTKATHASTTKGDDAHQAIIRSLGRNFIYVFIFAAATAVVVTSIIAMLR
ncbi:hypothetical protein EFQ99_31565 [Rhizobium vallis]|uniref:Uncharacterized protein n=1 Tax=Rhizobium vallis TaxID=634290 RepID=A0A3S0T1A3_9HYPH|nr:hypothetical protein [Rhizobium vallis]RUM19306.1 hypothetical protein EFQ99_31565 [Rhizobium vallis]